LFLKKKLWTMDKVQKQDSSKRITPSSEPFRIDSVCLYCIWDLTFRPTTTLDGGEWSASRPGRALPPQKEPPVPNGQEVGWARAGLDTEAAGKFLCLSWGSNRCHPACSQETILTELPQFVMANLCFLWNSDV
jgi:hypothetical protein